MVSSPGKLVQISWHAEDGTTTAGPADAALKRSLYQQLGSNTPCGLTVKGT